MLRLGPSLRPSTFRPACPHRSRPISSAPLAPKPVAPWLQPAPHPTRTRANTRADARAPRSKPRFNPPSPYLDRRTRGRARFESALPAQPRVAPQVLQMQSADAAGTAAEREAAVASDLAKQLAYHVVRTPSDELPVYYENARSTSRHVLIKGVLGDPAVLVEELVAQFGLPRDKVVLKGPNKHIKLNTVDISMKDEVKTWLINRGF